jgi:iron(III) transport system permease protein
VSTSSSERLLLAVLVLVITTLSLLPVARLLWEAPAALPDVLAARSTWTALANSITTSVAGTALSLALGIPAALIVALTDLRGKAALVFAFLLPLMIPSQVTAIAWIELLGPASPLLEPLGLAPTTGRPHPLYGVGGISLLLGIEHAPLVFLALRAALRGLPHELIEAARASGAGPWRTLVDVVLPLARPALAAGACLAFVSSVGNFGTPALLGIPGGTSTLTVLAYQKLAGFGPRVLAEVAGISFLLALLGLIGVLAQNRLARRSVAAAIVGAPARPFLLGPWRGTVEIASWAVLATTVVLPLCGLLASSLVVAYGVPLSPDTATLENFRYVLASHGATSRAFANSLALAAAAAALLAAIAVPLAWLLVRRPGRLARLTGFVAELPYALPGVVLAIACILVFIKTLYNTVWIILFAYLSRFLTLALRPTVAGTRALDPALEEAAQMAGAGLARRLRQIVLPLIIPAAAAGALLVFLIAFNELTVSALLWSSGNETLGVVVFGLEQGGENTLAAALAVVTVVATLALMAGATLVARRLPEGALPWRG